jgi:hypothetical protein
LGGSFRVWAFADEVRDFMADLPDLKGPDSSMTPPRPPERNFVPYLWSYYVVVILLIIWRIGLLAMVWGQPPGWQLHPHFNARMEVESLWLTHQGANRVELWNPSHWTTERPAPPQETWADQQSWSFMRGVDPREAFFVQLLNPELPAGRNQDGARFVLDASFLNGQETDLGLKKNWEFNGVVKPAQDDFFSGWILLAHSMDGKEGAITCLDRRLRPMAVVRHAGPLQDVLHHGSLLWFSGTSHMEKEAPVTYAGMLGALDFKEILARERCQLVVEAEADGRQEIDTANETVQRMDPLGYWNAAPGLMFHRPLRLEEGSDLFEGQEVVLVWQGLFGVFPAPVPLGEAPYSFYFSEEGVFLGGRLQEALPSSDPNDPLLRHQFKLRSFQQGFWQEWSYQEGRAAPSQQPLTWKGVMAQEGSPP